MRTSARVLSMALLGLLAAACSESSTESSAESSDIGLSARAVQVQADGTQYSIAVDIENARLTPVWVSECYGLQRSRGGAWQAVVPLSVGCASGRWPIITAGSTAQRELSLLVQIADSLVAPQESLRAVFAASFVGSLGDGALVVFTPPFTLDE